MKVKLLASFTLEAIPNGYEYYQVTGAQQGAEYVIVNLGPGRLSVRMKNTNITLEKNEPSKVLTLDQVDSGIQLQPATPGTAVSGYFEMTAPPTTKNVG